MYDRQQPRHRGAGPAVAAPRAVAVRPLAVTGKLLAPVIAGVAVGRLGGTTARAREKRINTPL
jgi:hypothetical protein